MAASPGRGPALARMDFRGLPDGLALVPAAAPALWRLAFAGRWATDAAVATDDGRVLWVQARVLATGSPVFAEQMTHSRRCSGRPVWRVRGIRHEAAIAFIRYLYSYQYDAEDMQAHCLALLALAHVYQVPTLKEACTDELRRGLLDADNAVDALQLARLCSARELATACKAFIVDNFAVVSATDGWRVMCLCGSELEQELVEAVIDSESALVQRRDLCTKQHAAYAQLKAAMDALPHVFTDGRCLGLQNGRRACHLPACRSVESLVSHFVSCHGKCASGCCASCRRMWQLLELHARMCNVYDNGGSSCHVPLCRQLKPTASEDAREGARWRDIIQNRCQPQRLPQLGGMPAVTNLLQGISMTHQHKDGDPARLLGDLDVREIGPGSLHYTFEIEQGDDFAKVLGLAACLHEQLAVVKCEANHLLHVRDDVHVAQPGHVHPSDFRFHCYLLLADRKQASAC
eukprot:SM000187S03874  [mRNA]  locus=s187:32838:35345:- [translate_table: standard]